jgi:hypothetical protein
MARLDQTRGTECIQTLCQPVEVLKMTLSVSSVRIQECGRFRLGARGPEGQHLC